MGQRETFLIFLVIFGHILDREASPSRLMETINFWIYSFHMPAFIFVSGLFSKHAIKQRKYLRLLSFVWLYLLAKLLITLANFAFANKMNFDLLNETGVPWYLLSLASFYLITIFLQRVQPKSCCQSSLLSAAPQAIYLWKVSCL